MNAVLGAAARQMCFWAPAAACLQGTLGWKKGAEDTRIQEARQRTGVQGRESPGRWERQRRGSWGLMEPLASPRRDGHEDADGSIAPAGRRWEKGNGDGEVWGWGDGVGLGNWVA